MIYEFKRFEKNEKGLWSEKGLLPRVFTLNCSDIASCLENDISIISSDRVFSLTDEWKTCLVNSDCFSFDTENSELVTEKTTLYDYQNMIITNEKKHTIIPSKSLIYIKKFEVFNIDNRHTIVFERICGDFEVYVNGVYCGASMIGSGEFDISDKIQKGTNELVLRITPATTSNMFGENTIEAVGIVGDVLLTVQTGAYLYDYAFNCVRDETLIQGNLSLALGGNATKVEVVLANGDNIIKEYECAVEGGIAEVKLIGDFIIYSSETPFLYDIYVRVFDDKDEKECTKFKVGFSPLTIDGKSLEIDSVPIKLKGTVYNPSFDSDYYDELRIMKTFNMNAVWVKGMQTMEFYNACEELGLYVVQEIPFGVKIKNKKELEAFANMHGNAYLEAVAESCMAKLSTRANIVAFSFGKLPNVGFGKDGLKRLAGNYAKPIIGANLAVANDYLPSSLSNYPVLVKVPCFEIKADEIERLVWDKELAGVFADGFKDTVDDKNGLFTENNVRKDNAILIKYSFRPYIAHIADNRTLFIKNTQSFKSSDGTTVTLSLVTGKKEEIIESFNPMLKPGEEREFNVYLGEYSDSTKIHIRYDENDNHIATEAYPIPQEKVLPEKSDDLKAKPHNYTVINKVFTLDKTEENALPARSYFVPCSSFKVCDAGDSDSISDRVYSLTGEWDFAFFKENAPLTIGDDMQWTSITLPSSWESAGFEEFKYSKGYPFKYDIKKFTIEDNGDNKNSVGIYRRIISIGDNSFRYILSFAKVSGSIELQINGKYVGYSMLQSVEFDITDYIDLGENEIIIIVKKWTPSAYLFGADGFSATGIIGDVSLIKYRQGGLFDYEYKVHQLGNEYQADFHLRFFGDNQSACKVELKKDGNVLFEKICMIDGGKTEFSIQGNYLPYNNETKDTYDLYVKVVENNFVTECTKIKVGFSFTEINGDTFYYNGEPLKIRGIIYNPVYNEFGELLTKEDIKRDLALIKEYGFNTVRPIRAIPPYFAQLASEFGLFIIAGSPINTKASGYGNPKARNAVMNHNAFVSLTQKIFLSAFERDKNACNIIMYFLSEDGTTICAKACEEAVKKLTTKPMFLYGENSGDGLTVSTPTVNGLLDRINDVANKKPLFMSEYALASGIGCATMHEFDELVKNSACCVGGCIANFVDDVVNGVGIVSNGLFTYDRRPYSGAENIKYIYRLLKSEISEDLESIEIFNTAKKISCNDIYAKLVVKSNGKPRSVTRLDFNIPPQEKRKYDISICKAEGDMALNVQYYAKQTNKLLYIEQHIIHPELQKFEVKDGCYSLDISEIFDYLDIIFDCGRVRFSKSLGCILYYSIKGKEILKPDSINKGGNSFINNINRPFIRNIPPKTVITSKVRDFECNYKKREEISNIHVNIENLIFLNGKESYIIQDKYIINSSGAIEVFSVITPLKRGLPVMDCFGKQLKLNNSFGNVVYYGNGESDNYIDLCEHSNVGLYNLNVDKTFEKMPVLQECGNRTNVNFVVIRDNDGDGIVISARKVPFQLRISPYSDKEIEESYINGIKPKQSGVYVDINAFVSGIGDSEHGHPLSHYMVCSGEHMIHFDILPVGRK